MVNTQVPNPSFTSPLHPAERERLLLEHMPEVRYIAKRIHNRLPPHVPFEDLVHAGVLGLLDALDRFDPSKNVKLKTFAQFRIRGAILDSLRAMDWGTRKLRKQARQVEQAHQELSSQLGRTPSEAELADWLSMSLREFQTLLGELRGLELGTLQPGGPRGENTEDYCIYRPNGPEEDPFFLLQRSEMRSRLAEAISILDERERQVVSLYYLEELTMKEVGAVLGIGEARVSQIHSVALVRLRAQMQELLAATSGPVPAAERG